MHIQGSAGLQSQASRLWRSALMAWTLLHLGCPNLRPSPPSGELRSCQIARHAWGTDCQPGFAADCGRWYGRSEVKRLEEAARVAAQVAAVRDDDHSRKLRDCRAAAAAAEAAQQVGSPLWRCCDRQTDSMDTMVKTLEFTCPKVLLEVQNHGKQINS